MAQEVILNRRVIVKFLAGFILAVLAITIGSTKATKAAEGDVWLIPANQNVETNQTFDIEVHMDTGGKNLGAFNIYLDFDPAVLTVNTSEGEDPNSDSGRGFHKGSSTNAYTMMSNSGDIANGHFRFAGISASSYANGGDVHLATIHLVSTSGFTSGTANLSMRINELSDELGNALTSGNVTGATVTYASGDTHPPVRTGGSPSGKLNSGTTNVNITLNTNENATCKYDVSAGTTYDSMTNTFDTTGGTSHSANITGLNDGGAYVYYVRCQDANSNQNNDDFIISFSVNNPPTDISLSNGQVSENQPINTVVGLLTTTDLDGGDNHAYSLSCSTPGADDASFNINNNELRTSEIFDYETKNSYTICIRTDDGFGGVFDKNFTITINNLDENAPVLTEITPVPNPTDDPTPDYTFNSTKAGVITYGGSCSSSTTQAIAGNNTITFHPLPNGTYSDCTIVVTDGDGNISEPLQVTAFTVDSNIPTCTGFTYSSWGPCLPNNTQIRAIISTIPANCIGGNPVLTQECTYTPPVIETIDDFKPSLLLKYSKKRYKLSKKKKLYLRKKKVYFKSKNEELSGGKVQLFVDGKLEDEITVGDDGSWKVGKKIKKNGHHKIKFKYYDREGGLIGESKSYKVKIDTKKPKFINLPKFLTKKVGEKVHFEATDTKSKKLAKKKRNKIKYYKYYFRGKKHKTKKPEFTIPTGTPKGLHMFKVRAYDKAGNKATKIVFIRVK